MRPKTPKKWKKGDPITAQRLNEMLDLIMRLDITVPQGGPLHVQQSATGTTLGLDMTGYGFLAICSVAAAASTGSITSTPGSSETAYAGTFLIVQVTPTFTSGILSSVNLVTTSTAIYAYNPSKTTMSGGSTGIAVNTVCWIQMDNTGLYMATPLECF